MFKISIPKSINRILRTPLGSRVFRPNFGSKLYELRDRKFNEEYKLKATKYTHEAIKKHEPRVEVDKVGFKVDHVSGTVTLLIMLTNGNIVEVQND